MPVVVKPTDTKDEFIGRCMSEESTSFPNEDQRYSVCIGYWNESKMSRLKELKQLIRKS